MASSPLSTTDPLDLKLGVAPHDVGPRAKPLPLGIRSLDAVLPDAGLPRGGVVELGSPAGLGRATRLALAACAAAQSEKDCPWCAWIDSSHTLFAPGVIQAGVEPERLLVVRPEPVDVARIAVRVTASGVFSVVVIDRSGVPGAGLANTRARWHIVVRRLALAAEASQTTVLLLSSTAVARKEALPTAMRLELSRPSHDRLSLRITKDRRGRLSGPIAVDVADLIGSGGTAAGARQDRDGSELAPPALHALP